MVHYSLFILLICSFVIFYSVTGQHEYNCHNESDEFFGAQIIVFFAPWSNNNVKEYIGIYYYNRKFKPGDAIGLHVNNTVRHQQSVNYYYPTSMSGIIYTYMDISQLSYKSQSIYQQQCLGYAGSWIRDGIAMKTSGLSTHPDWMYQRKEIFKNSSLSSIIIPGTHNSGSYAKKQTQSTTEQFTITQDGSILDQLIFGARYLDFRPGLYNNEYWIFHGSFHMNPLKQIIDDVRQFLYNTQEIVILHFREFPVGFHTTQNHIAFINHLETEFIEYLLPKNSSTWESTFENIWATGKRLIISYDHELSVYKDYLWPPIPHMWGNVQTLNDLRKFLTRTEANHLRPRVSMAEFTMDGLTIMSHVIADTMGMDHLTLRKMGAIVGPNVTQWYNELFYQNASIIAVDYVNSTGIVEVAIEWNDRRHSSCYDNYVKLMT